MTLARLLPVLSALALMTGAPTRLYADECPNVRCDECVSGQHTCRVIACNGIVTDTFVENCVGQPCDSTQSCDACVGGTQTCRTIDCHGNVVSTFGQSCFSPTTCSAMEVVGEQCCYSVFQSGVRIDQQCEDVCIECSDPCGGGISPASDPRCH
jgi:hypothetical protein